MNRFLQSRFVTFVLYILLGALLLYMLQQLSPAFTGIYSFLKAVLTPFVIAMIIAYVLNPIVNMLNRRKMPRTIAVLLIYSVFVTSLIVIFINVSPVFMNQLRELNEHLPDLNMKAQSFMNGIYDNKNVPETIRRGVQQSLEQLEVKLSHILSIDVEEITATINVLFVAFIVPFLAFYMMKDYKIIEKTVLTLVPKSYRRGTIRLIINIDQALGNYVRGQFLVCLLIGLMAYIGYWLIGLPYPLLLASLVSLFNIIPYLGPFFGLVPALVVASTVSWRMMLFVVIINLIVQMLEGNVIGPQIVGKTLHLHPLLIIFALLVGGEVGGIVGMILAVPILAVLKVITQYVVAYYKHRDIVT